MKRVKRIFSFVLLLTLVVSLGSGFVFEASAATGKSKTYNATTTKTIIVKTEKSGSPYLTFQCDGVKNIKGAKAPKLSLKVYNHNDGTTKYYRVTGSGSSISSKLKLNKNTTYTVTVSYLYDRSVNWGTWGWGDLKTTGWQQGYWRITKTSKCSYTFK